MLRKMEYVVTKDISMGVTGGLPGDLDSKKSACNVGNLGSIPGLGRSGEANDNPIQHS